MPFTDEVFASLKNKNISTSELTLHVGAGTFQPVKSNTIANHEMHTEHILVNRAFIQEILDHSGPIIAVGTTSIRTLESLYWMGVKTVLNTDLKQEDLGVKQWEPYENDKNITREDAFTALLKFLEKNEMQQVNSSTQIIIVPGYNFQVIDGMITNFHQPSSTLLLLITAFIVEIWKEVYQHDMDNNIRFFK